MRRTVLITSGVICLASQALFADYPGNYPSNWSQPQPYTSDSYGGSRMEGSNQGGFQGSHYDAGQGMQGGMGNQGMQGNMGMQGGMQNDQGTWMQRGQGSWQDSGMQDGAMQRGQIQNGPMQGGYAPNSSMQNGMRPMGQQAQADYPSTQRSGPMDQAMRMSDNDKFTTDEDRRLGFQIRQQIAEKNPNIDLRAISLIVDDGSVRLTGQVRNDREKGDLSSMIREIKGVKNVNNKLEISANPSRRPLAANDPGSPYAYPNSTFPNSTTNWPNTYQGNQTMPRDNSLADKIRQAISNDNSLSAQAQNIGITINSNNITLTGTVKSESEKNRVLSKVRELSEGKAITNMIEVSPTTTR